MTALAKASRLLQLSVLEQFRAEALQSLDPLRFHNSCRNLVISY
jgi:hypothetical protein